MSATRGPSQRTIPAWTLTVPLTCPPAATSQTLQSSTASRLRTRGAAGSGLWQSSFPMVRLTQALPTERQFYCPYEKRCLRAASPARFKSTRDIRVAGLLCRRENSLSLCCVCRSFTGASRAGLPSDWCHCPGVSQLPHLHLSALSSHSILLICSRQWLQMSLSWCETPMVCVQNEATRPLLSGASMTCSSSTQHGLC